MKNLNPLQSKKETHNRLGSFRNAQHEAGFSPVGDSNGRGRQLRTGCKDNFDIIPRLPGAPSFAFSQRKLGTHQSHRLAFSPNFCRSLPPLQAQSRKAAKNPAAPDTAMTNALQLAPSPTEQATLLLPAASPQPQKNLRKRVITSPIIRLTANRKS